jgi:hypothetical protein
VSRTIAHVPIWARVEFRVPIHDHRGGPCDLPARLIDRTWPPTTRCQWGHDWNAMPPICSCELCHCGQLSLAERRAERRRTRIDLRADGRLASVFDEEFKI